jgi:hypothetical protein
VSPNFAYGYDQSILSATMFGDGKSVPSLDGGDLVTSTNGMNDEYFGHSGGLINYVWDVQDNLTLKYIGAYTDLKPLCLRGWSGLRCSCRTCSCHHRTCGTDIGR